MEKPLLIYSTFPDLETAESVARLLLEQRVIVCVNILPRITSLYLWQGTINRATEVIAIFKTTQSMKAALEEALLKEHPYETPVIIHLANEGAALKTLAWLNAELSG